ncbi:hypothetical protein B296_00040505 [Ensete ventricosum]|uniref:Structure-specific endonuclease subunit SLX1 homolog n=1 Tax=Ensete ventricosum TaxID=4639 RepID=A0A426Z8M3_ENSVE|nr:hypothetical protein B296_00040505 [Ensete ventricosum]
MGSGKGRFGTQFVASAIEKRTSEEEMIVEAEEEEEEREEGKGFFACYLLASLSPRHKSRTYIGYLNPFFFNYFFLDRVVYRFTVNPRRRIRQHNGEIRCGAWRTKHGRPWEMVLCIYGFPSNVSALQFEWAWQHPKESLAVRKAASNFKSLSGIANKIKIAYTMLSLPAWENLNLTVNFFSTKYMKHTAGCPKLPKQMKTIFGTMDELPCYVKGLILDDNEENHDEDNLEEDPLSTSLSVSINHVETDVIHEERTARHGLGTWKHDDFRQSMELSDSPCMTDSPKASEESIDDGVGVENLMGMAFSNENNNEDSLSTSLAILVDDVEVDAINVQRTAGLGLGTWKHDDFRQSMELTDSPCSIGSPKTTESIDEVGVANLDFGGIRKPMETTRSYCLIESPGPGQECSRTSWDRTELLCSEDPFDFLKQNNLESFRKSTPKSSNKKASPDSLPFSPESNVIDLLSPPNCLISCCSNKHKKTSVHIDIIDLTDSPISL